MNFNLTAMTRRARNPRRASIEIRPNTPTASMASDLYRVAYLPIIQGWEQWIRRIAAAYEKATEFKVTDSYLFRDAANDVQRKLDQAETWFERLIAAITPDLKEWALRSEKWQRGKWVGAVLTATDIDLASILSPYDVTDTVDAFLARNVALVKSVSDQTRSRISDIMFRSYQARIPVRQVAKDMSQAVGMSRARALRIAADQNSKLAGRLDQARQEQAGVTRFKYRSSHKKHPRAWHATRDGKVYDWKTRKQVGGDDVIDADDLPRMQPYCGCTSQAVLYFGA